MKFYTTQEYADIKKVDDSTVRKWTVSKELNSYKIYYKYSNLVLDPDTPKKTAIIGFMNLKGGAGKTTLSTNIAVLLAKIGFKVLLIDTDHQSQCKLFFQPVENKYSIDDILSKNVKTKEAIYSIPIGNELKEDYCSVDIIFSSYSLALFASDYKNLDGFLELTESVKSDYDFIIVDTSPNFDIINKNVASTVSHIVIPLVPVNMHIEGLQHQLKALTQIAKIPLETVTGILINNFNKNLTAHNGYVEYLKEDYKDSVFETLIPTDPWLEKVSTERMNIFDYRENCKSSQALKKITWEMLRRL